MPCIRKSIVPAQHIVEFNLHGNIIFYLGYLGTDPTLHTATVANVRSVNYQDTDRELAKLNTTIKEYLSKGKVLSLIHI